MHIPFSRQQFLNLTFDNLAANAVNDSERPWQNCKSFSKTANLFFMIQAPATVLTLYVAAILQCFVTE